MKVCYDHLTNSLRCTACGYDQELPGSYYGDPHAIVVAEEQMQSFHLCRSSETLTLPPIRTLRPAVPSARAVAMHVLGLKPA
jgi:hypothetical protein